MSYLPDTFIDISSENSTIIPLASGATFTGGAVLTDKFPSVGSTIKTDQNGVIYFEFSPDGTNWDTSLSFNYNTARINAPHQFSVLGRYFRIRFTNTSATGQTYIRLQTTFGMVSQLTAPINGLLAENYDATVVRPTDYFTEVATGKRQGRELWNKFGYNQDIDEGTEVIASWGGTFTPLTTASDVSIVSTSVNDTSGGSGCNSLVVYDIDSNREIRTTIITLNGTTPVTTLTGSLGINRVAMFLCGTGQVNAGTITATAVTGGSIMAQMPSGGGVTQQCIFHIPDNHNFVTEFLFINVLNRGKNAELTVKMWVYSAVSNGKQEVFKVDIDTQTSNNTIQLNPKLPFPITENTVMWLECTSDKNDVIVNARFSGILERTN